MAFALSRHTHTCGRRTARREARLRRRRRSECQRTRQRYASAAHAVRVRLLLVFALLQRAVLHQVDERCGAHTRRTPSVAHGLALARCGDAARGAHAPSSSFFNTSWLRKSVAPMAAALRCCSGARHAAAVRSLTPRAAPLRCAAHSRPKRTPVAALPHAAGRERTQVANLLACGRSFVAPRALSVRRFGRHKWSSCHPITPHAARHASAGAASPSVSQMACARKSATHATAPAASSASRDWLVSSPKVGSPAATAAARPEGLSSKAMAP